MVVDDLQKMLEVKRFHEEICDPQRRGPVPVVRAVIGGHHNESRLARACLVLKLLDVLKGHETVEARHSDVAEDKMEESAFRLFDSFRAAARNVHRIPLFLEDLFQRAGKQRIVINDQHPPFFRFSGRRQGYRLLYWHPILCRIGRVTTFAFAGESADLWVAMREIKKKKTEGTLFIAGEIILPSPWENYAEKAGKLEAQRGARREIPT